jgi:hypothetical protein
MQLATTRPTQGITYSLESSPTFASRAQLTLAQLLNVDRDYLKEDDCAILYNSFSSLLDVQAVFSRLKASVPVYEQDKFSTKEISKDGCPHIAFLIDGKQIRIKKLDNKNTEINLSKDQILESENQSNAEYQNLAGEKFRNQANDHQDDPARDCKLDDLLTVNYFLESADKDNAKEKKNLHDMFLQGRGIDSDPTSQSHTRALEYLNEAAGNNCPHAQYQLGVLLMYTKPVQAIQLFEQSASEPGLKKNALKNIVLSEFHLLTEFEVGNKKGGRYVHLEVETQNNILKLACDASVDKEMRGKAVWVLENGIHSFNFNKKALYKKLAITLDPNLAKLDNLKSLEIKVFSLEVTPWRTDILGRYTVSIDFRIKIYGSFYSEEDNKGSNEFMRNWIQGGGMCDEIVVIQELVKLGAITISDAAIAELEKIPHND